MASRREIAAKHEEIIALRLAGATFREISEQTGVRLGTCRTICSKRKITSPVENRGGLHGGCRRCRTGRFTIDSAKKTARRTEELKAFWSV